MSQVQKSTSKKETNVNNHQIIKNEKELNESELLHEIMKRCWGVNFSSPIEQELTIKKDFKVLDVGCGSSGTWLLQLSEDYPLAKFVGVDKTSKFPKDFSQNNLQFIKGDILKGLPFEDDSFDFVHMRFVIMEFTDEQWEDIIIKELVRVCKPGGWIEFLELEESKYLSPSSKRLLALVAEYLEFKGISSDNIMAEGIFDFLDATDQIDTIYTDERLVPIGNWGGDIGKLTLEWNVKMFHTFKNLFVPLRISKDEYEKLLNQYVMEVDYRSYLIFLRICCRKNP
ncbi:hypothetical protein RclHR1_00780008 [Rhizophagus clarus]|uniref:S-adenosyl-L-methionine-dependent methyltransferase n=1 Tax=Rhizophagus clarus TaxID=94130 RepID=A0A2Z6RXU5_9GLOM|nr:hypothetical protein RclHR1_00780008 [Rhizophagus clarus]GES87376.1 S-adenosyl-L-methionine-dependent methyltransferase [Rhizophagus clarus]